MGLFSLVGGLIGAGAAKRASRKAEAAQLAFGEKAMAEQTRQFNITDARYAPALSLLAPSTAAYGDYIGLNGVTAQQGRMDQLRSSPMYDSLMDSGQEQILQSAAATGGLRGGNTQNALFDNGRDTFNMLLQQQLEQLSRGAGIGLGATDSVSSFGANKANRMSDLYGQQGAARAGGLLTRGGITSGMWNNVGSFADGAAKSAMGGGAGGIGGFLSKIF